MSHYLNIGHTQVECAAVGIMAQDKLLSYFRNKSFLFVRKHIIAISFF